MYEYIVEAAGSATIFSAFKKPLICGMSCPSADKCEPKKTILFNLFFFFFLLALALISIPQSGNNLRLRPKMFCRPMIDNFRPDERLNSVSIKPQQQQKKAKVHARRFVNCDRR